jgi:hypothetical protein
MSTWTWRDVCCDTALGLLGPYIDCPAYTHTPFITLFVIRLFLKKFFVLKNVSTSMGVWQAVPMDSLKFHPLPPCPTLSRAAGGPPLKWPYCPFRGGPLTGRGACSRLLPLWTPHAVRPCSKTCLHRIDGLWARVKSYRKEILRVILKFCSSPNLYAIWVAGTFPSC